MADSFALQEDKAILIYLNTYLSDLQFHAREARAARDVEFLNDQLSTLEFENLEAFAKYEKQLYFCILGVKERVEKKAHQEAHDHDPIDDIIKESETTGEY